MEQGNIMEAEVLTVYVGATPTGLMAPPPQQPPKVFYRPIANPMADSESEARFPIRVS